MWTVSPEMLHEMTGEWRCLFQGAHAAVLGTQYQLPADRKIIDTYVCCAQKRRRSLQKRRRRELFERSIIFIKYVAVCEIDGTVHTHFV
jgi:hypothetical protein